LKAIKKEELIIDGLAKVVTTAKAGARGFFHELPRGKWYKMEPLRSSRFGVAPCGNHSEKGGKR
jgi:hypothetical protein